MKIDIYSSAKAANKYLSVPAGTKLETFKLPNTVDPDLHTLSPFKTRLELDPDKPRKVLDQADVVAQIAKQGFAVHDAKVEINLG